MPDIYTVFIIKTPRVVIRILPETTPPEATVGGGVGVDVYSSSFGKKMVFEILVPYSNNAISDM